jgi:DNA-binding response OmpR family regulator
MNAPAADPGAGASAQAGGSRAWRIAYLEDEAVLGRALSIWLEQCGYAVDWFTRGQPCALALERGSYDLALLDWMVPDLSGFDIVQRLRQREHTARLPVIMLSGRDTEQDVAQMLLAGADDYMVKPPSPAVLQARIVACLRRGTAVALRPALEHGRLRVEFEPRRVLLDGRAVDLSPREADLALYLFSNLGRLLTRAHLANVVWGMPQGLDTRTIDVHVSKLRRMLALEPAYGWRVASIYGQGYRLECLSGPDAS